MRIKFDKDQLAAGQKNYLTKIVNIYIVYDLDAWQENPTNNFKFKNCMFDAINIVKNSDKEKYVYCGYGTTIDSRGFWSFDFDTARNVFFVFFCCCCCFIILFTFFIFVIIFGVNNSSSSHANYGKNNFLVLVKVPTFRINGSFGSAEKNFSINFRKANTKFCSSLHYNADNSYLFVNGKEIFKFKTDNKKVNFPAQFCLGSISNGFRATESKEVSLNENVYDFCVYVFILLLNFCSSLATKCPSLNDEPCMVRTNLIDLNLVEFKYYPFMTSLDKCNGSCIVLSAKICVPKKTKDTNTTVFNMITNKNEAKQ